ncbi:MarR family winged helix-turn-helix transcriptional regulator [Paenibacillus pinistramenti]|uniref:MarR family winged helix-turn-helix transcriptional regulator n=1 Tax=Paenibacillus pinistramenti TaxID=1768003 RepID=UPI0013969A63|nr:MarR family transcriptional regulator [Paenibacillus pinistramenti]
MDHIKTDITLDFLRISNLLSRYGAKMVADVGLSSIQQWVILSTISRKGEISIGELKKETLVTKQNMTGMVNRLHQSNLVALAPDPADKRRTIATLTEHGHQVYEQLKESRYDFNAQAYQIYDDQEIHTLSLLLGRLVEHLKEDDEN